MPAQKRSHEALYEDYDDDVELQLNNQNIHEESEEEDDDEDVEPDEQAETDDDGSASSSCSDRDEFILVKLAEIRKEVQCPICLGIIRKTRTVMECLHRFCRECIDKSMRLGNNECPACRAHCKSRRSLRDDPNYDALIAVLYPNIDKYEAEQEFAFHEEEKARNKQIQASIAQTSRRQLEALGKKRTNTKTTAGVFMRRSQNTRNLRGRRNRKSSEPQDSENEEDDDDDDAETMNNNGGGLGKESSSDDECVEPRPKRCSADDTEAREILAWGRGGIRSHTRQNARNTRVSKIMDHLRKLPQNNDKVIHFFLLANNYILTNEMQFDDIIHVKLVPLDDMQQPLYLCCTSTMPITHVAQYIGGEKGLQFDEIELLLVKGGDHEPEDLQLLENHQTLLHVANSLPHKDLVIFSSTNYHHMFSYF
ncbi:hypothetical protein LXL04_034514 [Taraxacum kok-saghyz]